MSKSAPAVIDLVSYTTAGALLGVDRKIVAFLVKRNGLTPKPMPSNVNGKALDASDLAVLRESIRRARVPASAR